jgi:hypothetical protein
MNRCIEVVQNFNLIDKVFWEAKIFDKFRILNIDYNEMSIYEQSEIIAFMLTEDYKEKEDGWGIYYGPHTVWITQNGERVENPSIDKITKEVIDYWKVRVDDVISPILISRYSDLVIEFSKLGENKSKDYQLYKNVIDNNILIYEKSLYKHKIYAAKKLKRAFDLAKEIKDNDSINKVKKAIIDFESHVEDDKPGIWGNAFELFIMQNKKIANQEEKNEIIELLVLRVERLMVEKKETNILAIEKAIEQLATYYRSTHNNEAVKNILEKLEEAYNNFLQNKAPMQRHNFYEKLHSLYSEFGLMDKAKSVLAKIREEGKEVVANMQEFSFSRTIQNEEIEKYIKHLLEGDLDTRISRIVWHYIPNKDEVVNYLMEEAQEFPLQFLFANQLLDSDGRVIANIGSLENDLEGNVICKISENMSISKFFMAKVFKKWSNEGSLNSAEIIERLERTTLISDEKKAILQVGLDAYFDKNYIVSINVLIPQIEAMFRTLVELAGGNVLKVNRQGNYQLITFDQVLREPLLENIFGNDTMLYLRILFTDQRGWNIRNNVCHGLINDNYFTRGIADRIIHTMLLLGLLKKK